MPNVMDVHEIIQRLKEDKDTELMRYELETMLEREMTKPESEMDVQLIDELLSILQEAPSEEEKQTTWESIEKQTQKGDYWRYAKVARRLVASILVLCAVSFVSIGSAYAFNWTFLLKLLKPLAETFGIYSTNNLNTPEDEYSEILYSDEDTGFEQSVYTSAEEMPTEWNGFRVQPTWLPERYTFMHGSMYADDSMAILSVSYHADEDFFNLVTTFFNDNEDVSCYEYEKTQTDLIVEEIGGQEVTYYQNSDDLRLSASWINQNAHYSVSGDITEEEMKGIVQSILD